jgi:hypothetical protein
MEGMDIMVPELKYLYKNMVHKSRPAFWEQLVSKYNECVYKENLEQKEV